MHKLNMSRRALAAPRSAWLLGGAALAQQPRPHPRRDQKADGAVLALKTRERRHAERKVADDARVSALVKASLADIKKDAFIGVGGMPQADGSQRAISGAHFLPRRSAAWARASGRGTRGRAAP